MVCTREKERSSSVGFVGELLLTLGSSSSEHLGGDVIPSPFCLLHALVCGELLLRSRRASWESSFCCLGEIRGWGIGLLVQEPWRGLRWMTVFGRNSPISKFLLLQHQELVNGGKTRASVPEFALFFSKSYKHKNVMKFIVLLLLEVIK